MKLFYPYNEILPKQKAHDLFIVKECSALQEEDFDVTLLCGKGSLEKEAFFSHYNASAFRLKELPIVRKNLAFNLSWNLPFFYTSNRFIQKNKPDWVILSVLKQGSYLSKRRIKGVRYLYEVHELSAYPTLAVGKHFLQEKEMLENMDLITTTTHALKRILKAPPYSLKTPVEVVSLACDAAPLPPPHLEETLLLGYVGQLYQGQGLETAFQALTKEANIHLKVIGGREEEIDTYKKRAQALGIEKQVHFLGFVPPGKIKDHLSDVHAFIAPFEASGRMPFVAHTKLFEYIAWQRPIIAPLLPITQEHLEDGKGALLFESGNADSLAHKMRTLLDREVLNTQQRAIEKVPLLSWQGRAKAYARLLHTYR